MHTLAGVMKVDICISCLNNGYVATRTAGTQLFSQIIIYFQLLKVTSNVQ
jgi:hypothetical protein